MERKKLSLKWERYRSEGQSAVKATKSYGDMEIYELNHSLDYIVLVSLGWQKLWERWIGSTRYFVRREPTEKSWQWTQYTSLPRYGVFFSIHPCALIFLGPDATSTNIKWECWLLYEVYGLPDARTIRFADMESLHLTPYSYHTPSSPLLLISSLPIKFPAERDTST